MTTSIPFLSMVRRPCEETRSLIQRFSEATQKRRSWMFGCHLRRVALLACETLLPLCTRLPVTWQIRLMVLPRYRRVAHGPGEIGPAGRRSVGRGDAARDSENEDSTRRGI